MDKAINLLQSIPNNLLKEDAFAAIDITEGLMSKYAQWMKADIVSVRIVQPLERVWLEITQEKEVAGYLVDQTITRTDLGFISDDDDKYGPWFSPNSPIAFNAKKFVDEFDPYSIMHTSDLFHEEGANEVNEKYKDS